MNFFSCRVPSFNPRFHIRKRGLPSLPLDFVSLFSGTDSLLLLVEEYTPHCVILKSFNLP